MACRDFIKHYSLSTLSRNKIANRFKKNAQPAIKLLHPCFFFFPFFRPSRCISVARQMSLNARPGLPFQKLNVSSSVVSISTQPDQLFSGLSLFNLSDRKMRLTFWHVLALGCQTRPMDAEEVTECGIK